MLCRTNLTAAGRSSRAGQRAFAAAPARKHATRATARRAVGEPEAQQANHASASAEALVSKRAVLGAAAAALVLSQASRWGMRGACGREPR
jgi:hypothetical protein